MKCKAVLLGLGNRHSIARVYQEDLMARLRELVDLYPVVIDQDQLAAHEHAVKEAEFAFSTWGMPVFSETQIDHYFPRLKALFYAAGSVQSFARPFLNKGIAVVSAWMANAVPVAEYTVGTILLANKGVLQTMARTKRSYKEAAHYAQNFPGNYRTKVGILGAGSIGRNVIKQLSAYDLELQVFDPFLPDEDAQALGVRKRDLLSIFADCQTISNHLANLPETVGMLNETHFERMLPYATFLNTGRGAQVVEADLIRALKEVPTRTAVLDVTDPEPPVQDSEWYQLDNVILTPHMAGSMNGEVCRMAEMVIEECRRYLQGEKLQYEVTLRMLETMA